MSEQTVDDCLWDDLLGTLDECEEHDIYFEIPGEDAGHLARYIRHLRQRIGDLRAAEKEADVANKELWRLCVEMAEMSKNNQLVQYPAPMFWTSGGEQTGISGISGTSHSVAYIDEPPQMSQRLKDLLADPNVYTGTMLSTPATSEPGILARIKAAQALGTSHQAMNTPPKNAKRAKKGG